MSKTQSWRKCFLFSLLSVIVSLPFLFVSVRCQTAPLVRCGTEIKRYCPAALSDDNVLCRCQRRDLGCLLFTKLFPVVRGDVWAFWSRPLFCGKTFNSVCFFNLVMLCHPEPTFITLLFGGEGRGRRRGWIINWKNWFLCHAKDIWELLNIKCKKGRLIDGFEKKRWEKLTQGMKQDYQAKTNILEAFKNIYQKQKDESRSQQSF